MGLGQVTEIADVDLYKLVRGVLGPSKEGATGNTLQRGILWPFWGQVQYFGP